MTSLCVIGDSHVGALKRAWDTIGADHPSLKITFFAQRGRGLNNLVAENGTLSSNNESVVKALEFVSGGKTKIDPQDYNVFLIYGCDAAANFVFGNQFYSKAVLKTAMDDIVNGTLSFKLLTRLRTITDKPAFLGHNPLIAAKGDASQNSLGAYIAGIRMLNDLIYRPLNSELLMQPVETIVNGRATRSDLSKGSRRLSIGNLDDDEIHPEVDNHHMNDEFGRIWLQNLLGRLAILNEQADSAN